MGSQEISKSMASMPIWRDILCENGPVAEGSYYDEAVIICITARVGSTALVSAMARCGLASEIMEIFNPRSTMAILAERFQPASIQQYVNCYFKENMKSDKLIFKTSYFDFAYFLKPDNIERLFPKSKYIYIYRQDVIAQAYSLWKANKFNIWHFKQYDKQKNSEIAINKDDALRILRISNNLLNEKNQWLNFFVQRQIRPLMVGYEDISSDLDGAVKRMYRFTVGREYNGHIASDYVKTQNRNDNENIKFIKSVIAEY